MSSESFSFSVCKEYPLSRIYWVVLKHKISPVVARSLLSKLAMLSPHVLVSEVAELQIFPESTEVHVDVEGVLTVSISTSLD